MLAPGESFPSEAGIPSGDVNPTTNSTTESSPVPTTSTSASAHPSATTAGSPSHKLSSGAIAGIVIAGVVVALLIGALLFLLGRHRTMLQFLRGNHYHNPGPQNPPGDQDMQSPPPHMAQFPSPPPAVPYPENPNYHDAPPYTEHAQHVPTPPAPPIMAELPSSEEKKSQEHVEMDQHLSQATLRVTPVPSPPLPSPPLPPPQARPLSFWGRSRSTKTQ